MSNEKKEELGIARLLPDYLAMALSRAAELARNLPINSLQRAKVIRDAEKKARIECPQAFRDDDGRRQ